MNMSENIAKALGTFEEEARELIAEMEAILLRAESEIADGDDLAALFRCAHTIKGSGGLFGLDEVVRFTHVVENVLDRLRKGTIRFSTELISLLLESQDQIAALVDAALNKAGTEELNLRSDSLIVRLREWAEPQDKGQVASSPSVEATGDIVFPSAGGQIGADHWHLSLRFGPSVLRDGMDPLTFISYLSNYGEIRHVETVTEQLPQLDQADAEICYLGFEVALHSQASKKDLEGVFEFVTDNSTIRIFPPHTRTDEFIQLIESSPAGEGLLGEILVACGTLTQKELDQALLSQKDQDNKRLGDILVESKAVEPAVVEAAANKQRRHEEKKANEAKSIKVPSERMDALIDHIGELVIAGAGMAAKACGINSSELHEAASHLLSLVEGVRDMTLRLRMVPIGEVFSRFPRVVRDVSRELGKDIDLEITGADAELDKSMVEKLGDPLMHLIRNSMDHGIESREDRLVAGKPEHGIVRLNAYHESGTIVVEVSDDGKGLNPAKILAKAQENGLVPVGATLSEQDIFRLILEPGFSTAEKVTNLSGRGVGMDVVRSNVESMRGTLDIQSREGLGTTMRICLPLTLAIIDGFHVGVGHSHFIVPLDMVVECVEFPPELATAEYMELRDEAVPFVVLRRLFEETGPAQLRPRVVVVRFGGRRIGLVVDRIFGKCQTVIKPLGPLFEEVPCVSGSTILGSGDVALIIDVAQLAYDVVNRQIEQTRRPTRCLAAIAA